jgi:hypothetical protein
VTDLLVEHPVDLFHDPKAGPSGEDEDRSLDTANHVVDLLFERDICSDGFSAVRTSIPLSLRAESTRVSNPFPTPR